MGTHVALDELAQVRVPDLERDREREQVDAALVHLQAAKKCETQLLARSAAGQGCRSAAQGGGRLDAP